MKRAFSILILCKFPALSNFTYLDVFNGIFEGSADSLLDGELSQEDKEFLSNCALVCSDGACIQEEQKCDGKRHCVDGSDERDCQGKNLTPNRNAEVQPDSAGLTLTKSDHFSR